MSFEQNIQQWVAIDNQIKILNDRMKELREKKTQYQNKLIHILKLLIYLILL